MSGYKWAGDAQKIANQTRTQTARKARLLAQYETAKTEADQLALQVQRQRQRIARYQAQIEAAQSEENRVLAQLERHGPFIRETAYGHAKTFFDTQYQAGINREQAESNLATARASFRHHWLKQSTA
ncbi:MAG: DUF4349 domain-containing protein [Renibacterium salmoninarum]|jgi:chromosome segregation ATPase|nr:DUF4349 domain-containing protein [Renibacterium salmoninarum]